MNPANGWDREPMRRSDMLLLASVVTLMVYLLLSILVQDLASPVAITYHWLLDISSMLGYQGDFLISFLGNATVLVPFPYMAVTFILGGVTDEITSQFHFDPWLLGFLSGLGAVLGEMTGYLIGYSGRHFVDKEQRTAFGELIKKHPRATPLVLWFLAVTPIPDDMLIIPLGAARYPWWKVIIPQFIGKTMFMTVIAWSGRLGVSIIGMLIGSTDPSSILSRIVEVASVLLIILGIYVLVRIDWTALMLKREDREETPTK